LYPESRGSFELIAVLYFKIIKKHTLYYEANEVRKFALENIVNNKNNFIYRILTAFDILINSLAESCIKYYDGVIAISTNMVKYHKANNSNIIRIPILSDMSNINSICITPRYNTKEHFNICFTGSINFKKEGLDILYKVIGNLVKKRKLKLHLYGVFNNGEKALKELSKELQISENIIYHGCVPSKTLISEMQKYHLLILPRPNSSQIKYGFSTKLSEYVISGVPALVTDVSDNSLYIIDGVNGFIVPPNNAVLMEQKILSIISDYNNKVELIGKNAYDMAKQNFDFKNYSKDLNDFLC
jgi:glycosyltransferase involved in cell wall biosynthesis